MYYNDPDEAANLAQKDGFSIFVHRNSAEFLHSFIKNLSDKNITIVKPGNNHKITIDQIREIISHCQNRQTSPKYVIISSADVMNEPAQNAFLKLLEEPPANYHFVMQVRSASALLPTILSRGNVYALKTKNYLSSPIVADETIKSYAKQIISAKNTDLVSVINRITNEKSYKKNSRTYALSIADCAIEISYKSYFKTKNLVYLKKLPKLFALQEGLKQNGNIKLHLVADLC